MIETIWQNSVDPEAMLRFLRGKSSARKIRLYACGSARYVWPELGPHTQAAVVAAEEFADRPAQVNQGGPGPTANERIFRAVGQAVREVKALSTTAAAGPPTDAAACRLDAPVQAALLRCLFGPLPFRV